MRRPDPLATLNNLSETGKKGKKGKTGKTGYDHTRRGYDDQDHSHACRVSIARPTRYQLGKAEHARVAVSRG